MDKQTEAFQTWAVVELMGHRRMAGMVTEQELFGVGMLRIDVPAEGDTMVTQFYSPAALYCLTPVTEQVARAYAAKNYMRPISTYDLALPIHAVATASDDDDSDNDSPF